MNCILVESGKGPFLPSLNLSSLLETQFGIGCHLILHCMQAPKFCVYYNNKCAILKLYSLHKTIWAKKLLECRLLNIRTLNPKPKKMLLQAKKIVHIQRIVKSCREQSLLLEKNCTFCLYQHLQRGSNSHFSPCKYMNLTRHTFNFISPTKDFPL